MKFGSLFTGIGGFDLAFEQAGMTCAWQCEINAAARSVLAKHWPDVPCYEDVRNVTRDNTPTVDLICGGFPCQDLSVAGKRAGLAGDRSGLWFEFHRILTELRPQWIVIENVPGLLSSNGGADFAVILRGLVECGYGVSWRIFDAQYFGVAQRRRRVFIVGSFGDGRSAEVLFEREGLFGHPPTRGEARQGIASGVAPSLAASGRGTERAGESRVEPLSFDWQAAGSERTYIHDKPGATRGLSASKTLAVAFGGNNTSGEIDIATAVNAAPARRYDFESETFVFVRQIAGDGQIAGALAAETGMHQTNYVAFQSSQSDVRRLTPTECERLQGFPDGHTAGQSDSARYRQLGNAVAVPVARRIGTRIMEVLP